jgi:hypothetical protein
MSVCISPSAHFQEDTLHVHDHILQVHNDCADMAQVESDAGRKWHDKDEAALGRPMA